MTVKKLKHYLIFMAIFMANMSFFPLWAPISGRLTPNFGFLTMACAEGGQPSFGDIWSGDGAVLIIGCRKAQDPDESSGGRRRLGVIWLPLLLVRTLLVI